MNIRSALAGVNLHALQQFVKWTVYFLLIVNFYFYILEDIEAAQHSLVEGESWLRWTTTFATTIDELAWFILLFLFELETYALSDEAFAGVTGKLIHGVRLVCYAFLAHTVYAYGTDVLSYERQAPLTDITSLCQLADREDMSYTYNLEYWTVDAGNCSTLSDGSAFYPVDSETLVTDAEGMVLTRQLAWVDLVEAVVWLLIVLLIEFMVRLQGRGVSSGPLIRAGNVAKPILYGILVLIAIWWGSLGQWLYVWDEFIWIAGFMAIEANVVEWRGEMREEAQAQAA